MSISEIAQFGTVNCPWLIGLGVALMLAGGKWQREGRVLENPKIAKAEGQLLQRHGRKVLIYGAVLLAGVVAYAIFAIVAICSG